MKIYCTANAKGGTGKTTTAAALIAGLVKAGKTVLGIELDPQGNLAYCFNVKPKAELLQTLNNGTSLEPNIIHTANGDIVPAGKALANYNNNYSMLKKCLIATNREYDYIIIDTPPQQGPLLYNALVCASSVILTANADPFNIESVKDLFSIVKAIQANKNPALYVMGILVTKYSGRSILNRESLEQLQAIATKAGTAVFDTKIREAVAVREAQAYRQNLFDYAPATSCTATEDYQNFIKEVLNNG